MDSLERRQVVGRLSKVNPKLSPVTVAEDELELDVQVRALERRVEDLRSSLSSARHCSIRDFWRAQPEQVTL